MSPSRPETSRARRPIAAISALLSALALFVGLALAAPTAARAAGAQPAWQFPFAAGTVMQVGAPHDNNALDFGVSGGASAHVVSVAAGTVGLFSCGNGQSYMKVDHGNGWVTGYYHLVNLQTSLVGKTVPAGTYLGDSGQATPCGGSSTFNHVHVHVQFYKDGQNFSPDGVSIGGFTVHSTGSAYYGYWTRNSDGKTVVTDNGQAACCITSTAGSTPPPLAKYETAFQASSSHLTVAGDLDNKDLGQGMAPGTSAAVALLPGGGYETAFQANNGNLYVFGAAGSYNTTQGMMPGTSPAIAVAPNGSFTVAFQGNNGYLYTYSSANGPKNLVKFMDRTSSPAITALANGTIVIAFQGDDGNVWTYDGGFSNLQQGMQRGTSPSIGHVGNGFGIAFQANNANLYTWVSGRGPVNTTQGMDPASSPVITGLASGGYEMAFQSNGHSLYLFGDAASFNTGQGMQPGTSPAIAGSSAGTFRAMFQANNHLLYEFNSTGGPAGTGAAMNAASSPCVASDLGGGCAPGRAA